MGVDCQDVHAALRRGPLSPSLAEHVAGCPACDALAQGGQPLAQALDAPVDPAQLHELFAKVDAAMERERGLAAWLRSRSTRLRALLAVLGVALVPVLVLLTWGRVDLAVYPAARWAFDLAVLLVPILLVLVVILRPLHRPAWPRWVEPVVVGLAVLAALTGPMLLPAHQHHPASLGGTGDALWPAAMTCLVIGTLMGLPLLPWLSALRRQGERWSRPALLAAMGAGATGVFAIFVHCPIVAPEHLLLGHAMILLPFFALGGLGLRR